ncbi:uncharacterized protein [Ptychodera flava]|uniref:uncharacterized protein n=1 Tax=Ptychodera flava TaxID=63121 RepID=UPI00396A8384
MPTTNFPTEHDTYEAAESHADDSDFPFLDFGDLAADFPVEMDDISEDPAEYFKRANLQTDKDLTSQMGLPEDVREMTVTQVGKFLCYVNSVFGLNNDFSVLAAKGEIDGKQLCSLSKPQFTVVFDNHPDVDMVFEYLKSWKKEFHSPKKTYYQLETFGANFVDSQKKTNPAKTEMYKAPIRFQNYSKNLEDFLSSQESYTETSHFDCSITESRAQYRDLSQPVMESQLVKTNFDQSYPASAANPRTHNGISFGHSSHSTRTESHQEPHNGHIDFFNSLIQYSSSSPTVFQTPVESEPTMQGGYERDAKQSYTEQIDAFSTQQVEDLCLTELSQSPMETKPNIGQSHAQLQENQTVSHPSESCADIFQTLNKTCERSRTNSENYIDSENVIEQLLALSSSSIDGCHSGSDADSSESDDDSISENITPITVRQLEEICNETIPQVTMAPVRRRRGRPRKERPLAGRKRKEKKLLWKFLLRHLNGGECSKCVQWTDQSQGLFRFVSAEKEEIARQWGVEKGHKNVMTYQKMARALRNYTKSQIMEKCPGKLQYKFSPRIYSRSHNSSG